MRACVSAEICSAEIQVQFVQSLGSAGIGKKWKKLMGMGTGRPRPLLFAAHNPAPRMGDFKMLVQKSHSAPPNKAHLHAINLYRLMTEVRALRDKARSLEVGCEAKTPATNPNRKARLRTENDAVLSRPG